MSCCGGNTSSARVAERELPWDAQRAQLSVEGMSCGSCVASVERALSRLDGVYRTSVSVGSADVAYNPSVISEARLVAAIEEAGYKVGGGTAASRSSGCCC